jgi:hypothetical protein
MRPPGSMDGGAYGNRLRGCRVRPVRRSPITRFLFSVSFSRSVLAWLLGEQGSDGEGGDDG